MSAYFILYVLYYEDSSMSSYLILKEKKVIQVDITSIVIFIWTDKNSDKFDQGQVVGGGSLI